MIDARPIQVPPPPHPPPTCFGKECDADNCKCVLYNWCHLLYLINALDSDVAFIEDNYGSKNLYGLKYNIKKIKEVFMIVREEQTQ